MIRYQIGAANEGGHYVSGASTYRTDPLEGRISPIEFAGTLDECLQFIRERMQAEAVKRMYADKARQTQAVPSTKGSVAQGVGRAEYDRLD